MIVESSKNEEEESGLSTNFEAYEYLLVEVTILNVLLSARYKNNSHKIGKFYRTVRELIQELPTESRKYVYRVLTKLENKKYVENLTPHKREKSIGITSKGEDALTNIIKYLYPDKEQQKTALKMFFDPYFIP